MLLLPSLSNAQPPDLTAVDEVVQATVSAGDVPGAVVLIGQGVRHASLLVFIPLLHDIITLFLLRARSARQQQN